VGAGFLLCRALNRGKSSMRAQSLCVLFLLTSASPALAAPIVSKAVGVRVTSHGLGFVSDELAGKDLAIHKDNVNKKPMSCFDEVGFNNLDLSAHVNATAFAWHQYDQGLSLAISLDKIDLSGQLYGKDSNFFDLCPTFSQLINQLELTNVVFTAEVTPKVDGSYHLSVTIDQLPQLSFGNMSLSLSGFPQWLVDLVTSPAFVQNLVQEKVNS